MNVTLGFELDHLAPEPFQFQLLGLHLPLARKRVWWIARHLLGPAAQHALANLQITCRLDNRNTTLLDQPNRLKLELTCKLPASHKYPSCSVKHLNSVPTKPTAAHMPGVRS